jgi:hypothetical protein
MTVSIRLILACISSFLRQIVTELIWFYIKSWQLQGSGTSFPADLANAWDAGHCPADLANAWDTIVEYDGRQAKEKPVGKKKKKGVVFED